MLGRGARYLILWVLGSVFFGFASGVVAGTELVTYGANNQATFTASGTGLYLYDGSLYRDSSAGTARFTLRIELARAAPMSVSSLDIGSGSRYSNFHSRYDNKVHYVDLTPADNTSFISLTIIAYSVDHITAHQRFRLVYRSVPAITISDVPSFRIGSSPFTARFTFSDNVTGFTASDISLGNATKGAFVTVNAKEYTLVITPISSDDVTVNVAASVATATASGLSNKAAEEALSVARPTLTISGVPLLRDGNAAFTATFTFNESVTGFTASDISLGNATKGEFVKVNAKKYTLVITPISFDDVTVNVAGNAARRASNTAPSLAAAEALSVSRPGLTISGVPLLRTATLRLSRRLRSVKA